MEHNLVSQHVEERQNVIRKGISSCYRNADELIQEANRDKLASKIAVDLVKSFSAGTLKDTEGNVVTDKSKLVDIAKDELKKAEEATALENEKK